MTVNLVESRIGEWRAAVLRGGAVADTDADELEGHLREQIADLEAVGLAGDEAFLIAVKRLGEVHQITAEFAREHGDRLWKQLAMPGTDAGRPRPIVTMLAFAALTAVLIQIARMLTAIPGASEAWSSATSACSCCRCSRPILPW